jgi:hypothetical protein
VRKLLQITQNKTTVPGRNVLTRVPAGTSCFAEALENAMGGNWLAANPTNVNACEGLPLIMDASAQAAGHFSGSK